MISATAGQPTLELHPRPRPRPQALARHGTLVVEVIANGDPARSARVLSALVNNSPMALARATVGDDPAYPVPSSALNRRGRMQLTLRMRDRRQHLDGILVAEIVEIVSTMCRVVEVRRLP